jgi:DNA-binding ferritin-like protein
MNEEELHTRTETAYEAATDSIYALMEKLRAIAPVTPATAEHLAKVRRFAQIVKDAEGLV